MGREGGGGDGGGVEKRWVYYGCADELRRGFWGALGARVDEVAEGGVSEALGLARDVGVLLWYGFAWDGGAVDRVVNARDDADEVVCLEAFLGVAEGAPTVALNAFPYVGSGLRGRGRGLARSGVGVVVPMRTARSRRLYLALVPARGVGGEDAGSWVRNRLFDLPRVPYLNSHLFQHVSPSVDSAEVPYVPALPPCQPLASTLP